MRTNSFVPSEPHDAASLSEMTQEPPAAPSRNVLERAIQIIEGLVDQGEPVGPRALARATSVDRSAVSRILLQLTDLDVVTKNEAGYQPGPRLFEIARLLGALDSLPTAAHAALAQLVKEFDETCYVCVVHGDSAVFLYEEQGTKPLRYVADLGRPVPLHAGAAGRAILAGMPRAQAARLLGDEHLPRLTANTITDPQDILDRAEIDATAGFTVSDSERVEGGVAVASPFFDRSKSCIGSVVFTSPVDRFSDQERVGAAVRTAAETLSARLGYVR